LEYACLDWFEKNYEVVAMSRCTTTLHYTLGGRVRRFLPDFVIHTSRGVFVVECKMQAWRQDRFWKEYTASAEAKKAALEKFSKGNGLLPFWFTEKHHQSFYRSKSREELEATLDS